jgi:hypothetical protein
MKHINKRKGEKKAREIVVPILNDEYKVVVCFGSPKQIEKVLHRWHHNPKDVASDMENGYGFCYCAEGCHPVIAMPEFPHTSEQIGTLAHEAVHAVTNIFDMVEEDGGREVFALSVGAIVREVLARK